MSRPSNNTGKRPTLWLVASALLIAACSGGEVPGDGAPSSSAIASTTTVPLVETTTTATTTTTTTTTTTIPTEVADAAIAVVVSAIEAKNRFDLDAWLMAYEGGRRVGTPDFAENILMNARQQWDFVKPCKVTGEPLPATPLWSACSRTSTSFGVSVESATSRHESSRSTQTDS